jgi:uncharacterized membrane protein (DUF373 family)
MYPLNRARLRWRQTVANVADDIEDAIYVLVAALLVIAGLLLLWSTVTTLYRDMVHQADPLVVVLRVLDRGLVLFIIAELLHTVRITIQDRALTAGPFLVVGLIAAIRRVLILTAQAAERGFRWDPDGIELLVLILLITVLTGAALLWFRASPSSQEIVE